ncbi:hypothetical protein [Chitinophaga varians]|nr:hypothetical protein [Chitinophaga varians]MBC9913942.1 hypothetical protein [Chitinophaga varians]
MPIMLLVTVFLCMGSVAVVTGITRPALAHGIAQILTAVTVGLAGPLVHG